MDRIYITLIIANKERKINNKIFDVIINKQVYFIASKDNPTERYLLLLMIGIESEKNTLLDGVQIIIC